MITHGIEIVYRVNVKLSRVPGSESKGKVIIVINGKKSLVDIDMRAQRTHDARTTHARRTHNARTYDVRGHERMHTLIM